ncbi:MAG: MFS transporter [Pseudoclavibacter sp.]|nr:MFS transporter [Pseudoclavibacter sp.]
MAEPRGADGEGDPTPLEAQLQPECAPPATGPIQLPQAPSPAPSAESRVPRGDGERTRLPAEIVILLVATFFVAIGFGLVVPVLPQFAASFGVGAMLVSIVVSVFAFMRLAAAPLGGRLVNRLGERGTYVTGILIVAVSTFATGLAQDYWQLLLMRGLGGVGSVLFTISASSMMITYAPPEMRGRVSALWGGTFVIGSISGPIFGGLLAQFGMRVPFFVYSGTLLVSAAVIGLVLGRIVRGREGARGGGGPRGAPLTLREVRGDSAFRALTVGALANGWANIGMRSSVLPLFVATSLSSEPWAAGAVIAVSAVGNVLALQWAGRAADRMGRRPLIRFGLAVGALAMFCFALVPNLPLMFAVAFVAGIGSGVYMPAQQAAVADVVGRDRPGGSVLSAVQMMVDVGAIIGPIVSGLMIDLAGYPAGFGVSGVVLLLAFAAWLRGRETLPGR